VGQKRSDHQNQHYKQDRQSSANRADQAADRLDVLNKLRVFEIVLFRGFA
jgi:hypothetical protein